MRPWGTAAGTCRHSAGVNCPCDCSLWSFAGKPSEAESLVFVSSALHTRQKRNLWHARPTSCVQPRDVLGLGRDSEWLMEAESRSSEGVTPQVPLGKQQATAGPRPADSSARSSSSGLAAPSRALSRLRCSEHLHELPPAEGRERQDASLTSPANFTT